MMPPTVRALACILCALGWAGADIRIGFQGIDGLSRRRLLEVINPEPDDYGRDGLRAWREDAEFYILDLYRVYGYFEAQVKTDLKPKEKDNPKDWEAEFTITEGPRYAFELVRVLGARLRQEDEASAALTRDQAAGDAGEGPAKDLDDIVPGVQTQGPVPHAPEASPPTPLMPRPAPPDSSPRPALTGPVIDTSDLDARPGQPFRHDALLADRRHILRKYGNAGFVRVEVDDKLDIRAETKTVAVDYLVDPGVPVIFDSLVVRNLRQPPMDTMEGITNEGILQDLVPYDRGDTVRMSLNDKLVEKLQYTGAFNFVRIKDSLRTSGDGRSTLYLFSEEHVPGNLRSSVFYETQYGPGVSVDARHSNVAGSLNEVRTGFSIAKDRQTLYAGYSSPLTLGLLVRFDDDLDLNWYQDQAIHKGVDMFAGDFRVANSARLTWPYKYWLRLVEDAQLEALSRMTSDTARDRDLSLNFIQTAFVTFVDQPMDPTRGLKLSLTWGNGGALRRHNVFSFADFRHNWFEVKTSHYYWLPGLRMIKLATRLDGGRFFGEGGPNSQRFFLGGSRSVRSYGFQKLCPDEPEEKQVCVAQNSALAYTQASAELRVEPFWWLNPRGKWHALAPVQVVPFADFGKVWDVRHPTTYSLTVDKAGEGQGYAGGVGIRYPLLGIFNLRLDWVITHGPQRGVPHEFWLDLAQAF